MINHYIVLFVTPFRIAFKLYRNIPDGIRAIFSCFVFFINIVNGKKQPLVLNITYHGNTFPVHIESSVDFALIREIFLDEEYRHRPLKNVQTIFDVGANVGMASLYFHTLYPGATIHAFEPNPKLFNTLVQRTRHISKIVPHPYALGAKNEIKNFYPTESALGGSFISRGGTAIQVPVRTLDSVAKELNISSIDLIKFDIEGAEQDLFTNTTGRRLCQNLIGEVHLDLMNMKEEEFIRLFPEFEAQYVKSLGKRRYIFTASQKG